MTDTIHEVAYNPAYIACPHCDTLHRFSDDELISRTRCASCGYRLTLGKSEAIIRVVSLALTSTILMGIVLFTPFLSLNAGSFASSASVVDVIFGFSTGIMVPLAFAVLCFIVVAPVLRSLALVYALAPSLAGLKNSIGAEYALRLAFSLKPWAMAEIFMVGVAVALVKIAGLATIETGVAFWAFVLLVLLNAFQDTFMCRNTLWASLATNRA